MTTTIELLDQAKIASGCASDYQFQKRFGIKQSTISMWRTGNRSLDDSHAALFAGILGREPVELMAICAAERAKDAGNRARWLRVAALVAAAVLPPQAGAAVDNNTGGGSIMRATVCQLWAIRRRMFGAPGLTLA